MACINVNLEEYKTLTKAFGTNLKTYVLTQRWQELNSTEKIPSIKDLKTMMRNNKVTAKKNKGKLQNDVINNLLKLDFIQSINDIYYRLNITPQSDINNLITKINNYLIINNIPTEFIGIEKSKLARLSVFCSPVFSIHLSRLPDGIYFCIQP